MTDNQSFSNQVFSQGAGSPDGNAQPVSPVGPSANQGMVQPQATETAVTPSQLQDLEARLARNTQSMLDKAMGQVNKKVAQAQTVSSQTIRTLEEAGIVLSELQKGSLNRTLVDKAYGDGSSADVSNPREQGGSSQDQPMRDYIDNKMTSMMQEAGVTIAPADMAPYGKLEPMEFLQKAKELMEQRKINKAQSSLPTPMPNGQAPSTDALRQEWELVKADIAAGTNPRAKRGDINSITRLYSEFKARGMKGQI